MKKKLFDAFVFDLDGVITRTALVHGHAWKEMFDAYLRERESKFNERFREFTHSDDYLPYVDGKPRYDGVASFLKSRGIDIPFGTPKDEPAKETVCALGNRKDRKFREVLKRDGVKVYDSTVRLIKKLRKNGIKVAVASSSKNCRLILESAGLAGLFETRVDGVVSARLGLRGKPEPDIFTTACDNLGVKYDRAVVVEDAVSGVQAGRRGRFGLVLGIARENNEDELKENGADIVVKDLREISLKEIGRWFLKGSDADRWSLSYISYNTEKESVRETLCTVGNGYFGTRGSLAGTAAGGVNYPATYIAGLYNRLATVVAGRKVFNEDFVNVPDWTYMNFSIDGGRPVDYGKVKIEDFERKINFRTGEYTIKCTVEDSSGRKTSIESRRIASMRDPHIGSCVYSVTPLNYSGKITVTSGLNGDVKNAGVARYRQLNSKHLRCLEAGAGGGVAYLMTETKTSRVKIAQAVKLAVYKNGKRMKPSPKHEVKKNAVFSRVSRRLRPGETLKVEKAVSIYTSRDSGIAEPLSSAIGSVKKSGSYKEIFSASSSAWRRLWNEIDIVIDGDRFSQKLVRMHLYHLMCTASPNNRNIDAGIPARGLHGEAYRGHIFWDELFILPFYNIHFPEVSKASLMYRFRRLQAARAYAKENGFSGAMFPWQSASTGGEETQTLHLNPLTGKWGDDYSSLQRHVSMAVAACVGDYFRDTGDLAFVRKYGAEIVLEICRFIESKARMNKKTGRYEIRNVMGPDEYHELSPLSPGGGLKDNSYTNVMAVETIRTAFELLSSLRPKDRKAVKKKLSLTESELAEWKDISRKLNLVIKDGIMAQFDGYFALKELDWDGYRAKYGNIHRMDRILKAEGKSPDGYKVAKQADVLMLFFNLGEKKTAEIIKGLGRRPGRKFLKKNFDYYISRTSHGSTLSKVVHAALASEMGEGELSFYLYMDALQSDFSDAQGGTTGEGIHTGVMAGTVMLALNTYAGVRFTARGISIKPALPDGWDSISFKASFRRRKYSFIAKRGEVSISVSGSGGKVPVSVYGRTRLIAAGKKYVFKKGRKIK